MSTIPTFRINRRRNVDNSIRKRAFTYLEIMGDISNIGASYRTVLCSANYRHYNAALCNSVGRLDFDKWHTNRISCERYCLAGDNSGYERRTRDISLPGSRCVIDRSLRGDFQTSMGSEPGHFYTSLPVPSLFNR